MAVSGISDSSSSFTPTATKPKSEESLQQLADEGDPLAIAELKQQQEQENPVQPQAPTTEPGKGQNIDTYI
jgi:hypothetical protein